MSQTPSFAQVAGMTDGDPWWGVPLIAGLFLVLGAVLAFVFNSIQDKRRATRERDQRWDRDVLAHTSSVISMTKKLRSAASDYYTAERVQIELMLDQQARGENVDPPTIARPALHIFSDAFDALTQECDQLALVAPPSVREAVRTHWELAAAVMRTDSAGDTFTPSHDLVLSTDALAATIRDYFGIERMDQKLSPR